jgi:hypothetical protein
MFESACVPPVVYYKLTAGPAYLIAWRQNPDRTWWGLLAWISFDGEIYRGAEAWAISSDLRKMPGQRYSDVPRRRLSHGDRRRPHDLSDPRDPGYRTRAEDRAVIDRQLRRRRAPEPPF